MNRLAGIVAAFVLVLASATLPASAQEKTLTVFAAASMKNALDDIDAAYTAKTGVKVNASYAASSALAKQIEQGAPADVFVSADTDWMDYAVKQKNINEATRINLTTSISAPASILQNLPATAGSRPATSRPCRLANTPRRRWRSLAPGRRPSLDSRWPKACARD